MGELLTAILVFITGLYVLLTYKILRANEGVLNEMKMQYEALNRPYISITPVIFSDNQMFYLKIQNTGKIAAQNLSLTLDRDFYIFGRKEKSHNLKSYSAFSSPIDTFPPGSQIMFYLAQGFVIFGDNADQVVTPPLFGINACFEYLGKKITELTVIDLRPYLKSVLPDDPIVSRLEEIKISIEKIKF